MPRKIVVSKTDCPDMNTAVYNGRYKTTQHNILSFGVDQIGLASCNTSCLCSTSLSMSLLFPNLQGYNSGTYFEVDWVLCVLDIFFKVSISKFHNFRWLLVRGHLISLETSLLIYFINWGTHLYSGVA